MNPFQSLRDYEEWIYSLPERFSAVKYSTLLLARRGRQLLIEEIERGYLAAVPE